MGPGGEKIWIFFKKVLTPHFGCGTVVNYKSAPGLGLSRKGMFRLWGAEGAIQTNNEHQHKGVLIFG
jgi:hypothetical protein